MLLLGFALAIGGCTEDTSESITPLPDAGEDTSVQDDVSPDMGEDVAAEVTPETVAPGGLCNCDSECEAVEGHAGICVGGVCMTRASADCSAGGSQAECALGSRCWGLQGAEGSICWPDCDSYTCAGTCDSDGSCVMTEATSCDPACGSYCGGSSEGGAVGGPCTYDEDCPGGQCYTGDGYIEGYCLIWGCSTPGGACGEDGICVPDLGSDGSNICMGSCEGGCREGYACTETDGGVSFCVAHCEESTDCPSGYACNGGVCGLDFTCSADRPVDGECPSHQICEEGSCVPFVCDDTVMEPNENLGAAIAVTDDVQGLQICDGDDDWFSFVPSDPSVLYVVGQHSEYGSGDIDVDLVTEDGVVLDLSDLVPSNYHDENPRGPMDQELMSMVGGAGAETYYLHVEGSSGNVNNYDLIVDEIPWADGPDCEAAGFTQTQCRAVNASGYLVTEELVPFPAGHPEDPYIGDGVFFQSGLTSTGSPTYTNASSRWGKRELIMAIRYAIHSVQETYPGTTPLGIGEISMPDGTTPYGHPNGTHYYGSNFDVSYYILPEYQRQWGNMCYRHICNDATSLTDYSAVNTTTTGTCEAGSEDTHIVDIPRTALFYARLVETGRVRVFGVDTAVEADLDAEFARLRDEGIISSATYTDVTRRMATANDDGSWVWHFHHAHISFCTGNDPC